LWIIVLCIFQLYCTVYCFVLRILYAILITRSALDQSLGCRCSSVRLKLLLPTHILSYLLFNNHRAITYYIFTEQVDRTYDISHFYSGGTWFEFQPTPTVLSFRGFPQSIVKSWDCSRSCSCPVQGQKPDSSQVVSTGRDLGDQTRTQMQNHPHTNNTYRQFSKDLLLTALTVTQIDSDDQT
jgi:hypothetical protein